MSKVQCWDVVEDLINEASKRFKPLYAVNEEKLEYVKNVCKTVIQDAADNNDAEAYEVEVDEITMEIRVSVVFCKPFLHKIAKSFCRLLHLHFVGNCKTTAGSYSASHKPLQIIFSCYNTRYGNGSSEFSSSCACSLK